MDLLHNKEQGGYKPVDLRHGRPKPNDNWPYHNHPTTTHDRELGIKDPKFERHIFIGRDDIFFDIDAQVQMVADARQKPDGSVDNSLVEGVGKFRPMFYRWIDTYIGKAKTIMSAFVLEKFRETAINSIKDVDEVDITFLMPEWYDDTTWQQLCNAVHAYVVNGALLEYFTLKLTSKDPVTTDKDTAVSFGESEIRKLCNANKAGTIHKKFKPF
jgi:hypothetical protein